MSDGGIFNDVLSQSSCRLRQWKRFENRSIFGKIWLHKAKKSACHVLSCIRPSFLQLYRAHSLRL